MDFGLVVNKITSNYYKQPSPLLKVLILNSKVKTSQKKICSSDRIFFVNSLKRNLVGGPATCQSQWLTETIQFCEANNVPIDFISTHEYPTDITPTVRNTLQQVMTKVKI